MIKNIRLSVVIPSLIALAMIMSLFFSKAASAAYDGGRLIDDVLFLNSSAMSAQDIQNFLAAKGSGFASLSYPFDCESTGMSAPYYRTAGAPCGQTVSASTIIYYASQVYGINPQVVLATLQKEQGSITDPTLSSWQINQAMGYACPTTGSCDSSSSFLYQIDNGVWLLRFHRERANGNMNYWFQSSSWVCGTEKNFYKPNLYPGQNVNFYDEDGVYYRTHWIANAATSSMYCYTPHAYNNPQGLYGKPVFGWTGRYYSGSYNFVYWYEGWFGPTKTGESPLPVTAIWASATEATVGQPITTAFTIRNPYNYPLTLPSVGVSGRLGNEMHDYGIQTNVTLAAYESREFVATFVPKKAGSFRTQGVYNYLNGWYGGAYNWINVHTPQITLTSGIEKTPEFPLVGSEYNISFTIKNTGSMAAYLEYVMAANLDATTQSGYKAVPVVLAPGQSYTYSDKRIPTTVRTQATWPTISVGGLWYQLAQPSYHRAYSAAANVQLTSILATNPEFPVINSPTTANFSLKNFGDQPIRFTNIGIGVIRRSDGQRFDFSSQMKSIPIVIQGGQEWTYSAIRTFPTKDTYDFFITSSYNGLDFSGDAISSAAPQYSTARSIQTYTSAAKLEFTSPIKTQQTSGPLSQILDLSYTVKNTGDAPTGDIITAFHCRQNIWNYCDIPGRTVNLSSGESVTMEKSLGYFSSGRLTFKALKYEKGIWADFGSTATADVGLLPPPASAFKTTMHLDKTATTIGNPITVTYTIQNTTDSDLQIPIYAIAARLNGKFYDFGLQHWFYLRRGETKSFVKQFSAPTPGRYSLFPVLKTANESWYGYNEQTLVVNN
jgi:archaellum component FlaG (FlaF/FlaG flagellin family)